MPQMATQHTPTKTPRGGSLSRRTVPKRDLIRQPSLNWRANSSRVGDFSFIHSPCASMSALRPLAGVVVFAVTRDHAHNSQQECCDPTATSRRKPLARFHDGDCQHKRTPVYCVGVTAVGSRVEIEI